MRAWAQTCFTLIAIIIVGVAVADLFGTGGFAVSAILGAVAGQAGWVKLYHSSSDS